MSKRMKRIAILSTHPIQYNAPLYRMLSLANQEIELKVFYSKKTNEVLFDKEFGQIIEWDIPLTEGYQFESFQASLKTGRKDLIDAIHAFKPAAILVYGWNFDGHLAIMRHFKGCIPIWFRGDSTLLDPLPASKRLLRKVALNWVYRFVDLAFYVGQANLRYYKWCGLRNEQLVYAPHAVDNAFFTKDIKKKENQATQLRTQLGIGSNAVVLLFAGKLDPIKQPVLLANAFCHVLNHQDEKRETHLIFVGSGALETTLKQEFGANQHIHFVGFQNQSLMPTWYQIADVLCLPSMSETWGLAVNEALVNECRVLVSNRVGCAEDLVQGKEYGAIFQWDNSNDLIEAMRTIIASEEKPSVHEIPSIDVFCKSILDQLVRLDTNTINCNI